MPGIYFHIPFCKKACHYCNFHFSTSLKQQGEMLKAMKQELISASEGAEEIVETIYFGGGTPSILPAGAIRELINLVKERFTVSPGAEVTLEANPDDISKAAVTAWIQAGVNRLSIGIQSFKEEDLLWMNRAHNAAQAKSSLVVAKDAGIHNISADLIYGTPTLSDEDWRQNIEQMIALGIPHIACYALTVEPKTALDKLIQLKKKENTDAGKQAQQFMMLMEQMQLHGYEHYEISNFALPGLRSRHNSSYWQGKPYIGIGPSAHSYDGRNRRWNISNNALYIQAIANGLPSFEEEQLTTENRINEFIMISLRTMEGLNLFRLEEQFGNSVYEQVRKDITPYIEEGKALVKNDHVILTKAGKLFADGIAADLFV
jgi:oxygen-independent coproporphyrinogen III oxidase